MSSQRVFERISLADMLHSECIHLERDCCRSCERYSEKVVMSTFGCHAGQSAWVSSPQQREDM